jgi:(p)ppGpp synthase/HD superfamily hydrolase
MHDKSDRPLLTERFDRALVYAARLHANQRRKGTHIPYVAHLLGVTAIVLEDGGDEDQAIAALLHDAAEDQGGKRTLQEIGERFGERVARIVEGCTDAFGEPKPAWKRRKEDYIAHLKSASEDVLRVSLADKIYNAQSVLICYRQMGEKTWERFNGGKEGTLWYYQALLAVFREVYHSEYVNEFGRILETLMAIVE